MEQTNSTEDSSTAKNDGTYWWVALPLTQSLRHLTALRWFLALDPGTRLWVIRQSYEGKSGRLQVE